MSRFSMELNRRVRDGRFLILLILGNIATVLSLSGPNLDCTNDFEEYMFCDFEAQNCSEYNLTLLNIDWNGEEHSCLPQLCGSGRCCCSVSVLLIAGETHTAAVWKDGQITESKNISVTDSIKPKTPTLISVELSHRSVQVKWKTNMSGYFGNSLTANVTYYKKGETEKVSQSVTPTTIDGVNMYEIPGQYLEPSTTYVVSVRSYTRWSDKFSDSSNEREFTTPASPNAVLFATIFSLSIAAALISGAIFACYVKLKTKLWDTVDKSPNPNILIIHPKNQEFLKPEANFISNICVEPHTPEESKPWSKESLTDISSGSHQQSSGISTGSSCLSYANTEPPSIINCVQDALCKAFPNLSPISPATTNLLTEPNWNSGLPTVPFSPFGVTATDTSSGSSCFDNKTYSILVPSCPHQNMSDSSEVQAQAEMVCDSGYHPSEGDVVICSGGEVSDCPLLNFPPVVSSVMPTDMSYQQCNADSGRFLNSEESSWSSISSGTNTIASCDPASRVETGQESFGEVVSGPTELSGKTEESTVCDDNPCYGCMPAGSHHFPPVDDDYQSFQNLVEQSELLFSEKYPAESFPKIAPVIPDFIKDVQSGQCVSELQRPFLSLISADQPMPVITESGYQSV